MTDAAPPSPTPETAPEPPADSPAAKARRSRGAAFWVIVGLMVSVIVGMIGFFKYKRWL